MLGPLNEHQGGSAELGCPVAAQRVRTRARGRWRQAQAPYLAVTVLYIVPYNYFRLAARFLFRLPVHPCGRYNALPPFSVRRKKGKEETRMERLQDQRWLYALIACVVLSGCTNYQFKAWIITV